MLFGEWMNLKLDTASYHLSGFVLVSSVMTCCTGSILKPMVNDLNCGECYVMAYGFIIALSYHGLGCLKSTSKWNLSCTVVETGLLSMSCGWIVEKSIGWIRLWWTARSWILLWKMLYSLKWTCKGLTYHVCYRFAEWPATLSMMVLCYATNFNQLPCFVSLLQVLYYGWVAG